MKKLVPPDGGTQTVFISTLSFVKKRLQHPQKASFGFIMSGFNRNIFMTIAIIIERRGWEFVFWKQNPENGRLMVN